MSASDGAPTGAAGQAIVTLRSFLFVPGDSERKLAKGSGSGADALILDLEDAVAPARKPLARGMVAEYLATHANPRTPELWVRINPLDEGGLDDLAAVVRAAPDGIMVPKIDGPADVQRLGHCLDGLERRDGIVAPTRILPVAAETARAPFGLGGFAALHLPRLYGLTWGAEDLSTAIGAAGNCDASGEWAFTFRMASSLCLLAAKAAGVEAVETVYVDSGTRPGCVPRALPRPARGSRAGSPSTPTRSPSSTRPSCPHRKLSRMPAGS